MDYTISLQKYAALVATSNISPYTEKFAAFSRTYAQEGLRYKTAGLQAFADAYARELQVKEAAMPSFRQGWNAIKNVATAPIRHVQALKSNQALLNHRVNDVFQGHIQDVSAAQQAQRAAAPILNDKQFAAAKNKWGDIGLEGQHYHRYEPTPILKGQPAAAEKAVLQAESEAAVAAGKTTGGVAGVTAGRPAAGWNVGKGALIGGGLVGLGGLGYAATRPPPPYNNTGGMSY